MKKHLLEAFLESLRKSAKLSKALIQWELEPPREALMDSIPLSVHEHLKIALKFQGIETLYSHQKTAWDIASQKKNFVLVTGTASGKSLCYYLPVLNTTIRDPHSRSLFIFPTKALAQDQRNNLDRMLRAINAQGNDLSVMIYDGDTSANQRAALRGKANLIITNPDMLHIGILPHHTNWVPFFQNLRYVILDEIHSYRGVFGSHIANLIRRLKRVAEFYGSKPQFIMTSATIGNPKQLSEKLIEEEVEVIAEDGAPKGERNFVFYNPPIVDKSLGARRSLTYECVLLTSELISYDIQSLVFTRSRRSVELLLRALREANPSQSTTIQGYRSGYLPHERREIENGLQTGSIRVVVATNALELGVDIGNLDAVIMAGYPGSISAIRQQAGRAGRKTKPSLAIFIASMDPIDQFLMKNPEFLLKRNPEHALIDPDNLLILLQHLECAAFELPIAENETFGSHDPQEMKDLLSFLEVKGSLHFSNGKYYWVKADYPASGVSIRTASDHRVILQCKEQDKLVTIGETDTSSSTWMVHPGAIYLHRGESYQVSELNLEENRAVLLKCDTDYYTEALKEVTIEKIDERTNNVIPGGTKTFGDIMVTTRVTGYRRKNWLTHQGLGDIPLDMPSTQLSTTAYWITLDEKTTDKLKIMGLWTNERNDYGVGWSKIRLSICQRDQYKCQLCGLQEAGSEHHVHHKVPFRLFSSAAEANMPSNLVLLCSRCHQQVEAAVRIRSGLAGLGYVINHLASLFAMCDLHDLGCFSDARSPLANGNPVVVIYDDIPAGIGLSQRIYELHAEIIANAKELISTCGCQDGCPGCVGPYGENGAGSKKETLAMVTLLSGEDL
jgi:DEAD/DEAH box helicase domain-containing protein